MGRCRRGRRPRLFRGRSAKRRVSRRRGQRPRLQRPAPPKAANRLGLAKTVRVVYAKPMADLAESARFSATSPTRRM